MSRILLLMENPQDRDLLAAELGGEHEVVPPACDRLTYPAPASEACLSPEFDLAILDGPSLARLGSLVDARRAREDPLFLPFLLVTGRQDIGLAAAELWKRVDEVIPVPIVRAELRARLAVLLRAREQSLALAAERARLAGRTAQLDATIASMPDAVILYDTDGRITHMNPAAERLFHFTAEDRSLPIPDRWGKLDAEVVEGVPLVPDEVPAARALSGDVVEGLVFSTPRADGCRCWLRVGAAPMRCPDGRPLGAVATFADITEARQREEDARRLAAIVQASDEAIVAMEVDGTIRDWNPGAERLYSYTAQEIVGRSVSVLMPPGTERETEEILACVSRGETIRPHDTVRVRKDGSRVDVAVSAAPIFDGYGKVVRISWTARDVTERKRAEAAVREERDRAQQYLNIAGVILVALDARGRVALLNCKGSEVLGIVAAEAAGQDWVEMAIPRRDRPRVRAVFLQIMSGELSPVEYAENPVLTRSGEERLIAWHNTVLRDGSGRITGTLSSGEDITERKRAEEARERLRAEAEKARAEAEEANRSKDQFVAVVSHELRNPLSAIAAGVDILRRDCPPEGRAARALDILDRNTQMQARLVNDLLDLSRLQRGKLELQRSPVDLQQVVAAACQSYEAEAKEAGLTLSCREEAGLWVRGDLDRLQQVVTNLLSNAVKFTPAGGRVAVRVEGSGFGVQSSGFGVQAVVSAAGVRAGSGGPAPANEPQAPTSEPQTPAPEHQPPTLEPRTLNPEARTPTPEARTLNPEPQTARIVVEDTGIGLEPAALAHLFEMFRQGEVARPRKSGLGIGLALVKGIVEEHGGRVWAESEGAGKGSRFTVELPLMQPPAGDPDASRPAPTPSPLSSGDA